MKSRYHKIKRLLLVLLIISGTFAVYVEIVNRNSKNMTYRQKVLKAIYPAAMLWEKFRGGKSTALSGDKEPPVSFYTLKAKLNNGETFDFYSLKGKKILIVNTASDCGYTNQYKQLQQLYDRYPEKLAVIAFPANDFKQQEKGSDEEIEKFCRSNFGITFALMQKTSVKPSTHQHEVYQWLTDPAKNGWNKEAPSWNFSKYLVDENGKLTNFFGPAVSPLSRKLVDAITD